MGIASCNFRNSKPLCLGCSFPVGSIKKAAGVKNLNGINVKSFKTSYPVGTALEGVRDNNRASEFPGYLNRFFRTQMRLDILADSENKDMPLRRTNLNPGNDRKLKAKFQALFLQASPPSTVSWSQIANPSSPLLLAVLRMSSWLDLLSFEYSECTCRSNFILNRRMRNEFI